MTGKPLADSLLQQFSEYISLHMGLHFPPERHRDLRRGIASAAVEFGYQGEEECVRSLMQAPLSKYQVEILASHLTIGETYFFRDPKMFETLERQLFPPLIRARRERGQYLRIWSAGCATGEEPYSIAILLSRLLPDMEKWAITILGTDINPGFLSRAAEGIYGEWSFRTLPPAMRERYFTGVAPNRHQIRPDLKSCVTFGYLNLAEDLYPSLLNRTNGMDFIFCRNVLMYFSHQQQSEVVRKFHRALVPHGMLVVSPTETSAVVFSSFVDLKLAGGAFYRKEDRRVTRPATPAQPARPAFPPVTPAVTASTPARSLPETVPELPAPQSLSEPELLYGQGRYRDTAEKLEAILRRDEDNVQAIELMARAQANLGQLEQARQLCEKAISLSKLDPGLYFLLATILQEMGLPDQQDAALKRVIYLDSNFVLAHFARGNLALKQNARREAERNFENALAVLAQMERDEVIPHSEGITAGRIREMIMTAMKGNFPL